MAAEQATTAEAAINEVRLVGRLSAPPDLKVLPSEDELVQLRVVVGRPPSSGRSRAPSRTIVDTIDVACWTAATRRRALKLAEGDLVEVTGALRRRFWRAGATTASRYEVEAATLSRVRTVS